MAIIGYIEFFPPVMRPELIRIFGEGFKAGPLPLESPIPESEELKGMASASAERLKEYSHEELILIAPSLPKMGASIPEDLVEGATEFLRQRGEWSETVFVAKIVQLRPCWALLFGDDGAIYPGVGVLRDKSTGRFFARRFIDLEPALKAT